jgi:DUF4097 and DUF4098 domain-containing protein YvlB
MTARARLLACLLPAALAAPACDIGISAGGLEGTFDRDLAVSGPLELEVTSGSGDIHIRTGADGTVHVHGRMRTSNGPWANFNGTSAEQRIHELEQNPPIEQTGGRIQVGPKRWNDGWNNVSISYDITVPANARVTARSGSGDLEVADLAGPLEVSTGSGDIRVGRIKDAVTAHTGSGNITVDAAAAARTSTGSGDLVISGVRGDLDARSGSGDITATQQGKGSAEVSTGSGDVDLSGATGPVHVRASSGDINLQGAPAADWDVSASSGNVRVRLPAKGGVDLDLHSNSGRIETSVPITVTGTQSRRELKGQLRGGGPRVQVSTSSGGIVVQ